MSSQMHADNDNGTENTGAVEAPLTIVAPKLGKRKS